MHEIRLIWHLFWLSMAAIRALRWPTLWPQLERNEEKKEGKEKAAASDWSTEGNRVKGNPERIVTRGAVSEPWEDDPSL